MRLRRRPARFDWVGANLRFATEDSGLGEGEGVLADDLEIGVRGTLDTRGRPLLPVFSSETELLAWFTEGSHWIEVQGRDALQLFLRGDWDRIVLDPAADFPPVLTRSEAEALLRES